MPAAATLCLRELGSKDNTALKNMMQAFSWTFLMFTSLHHWNEECGV